jgi:hypothetical protein
MAPVYKVTAGVFLGIVIALTDYFFIEGPRATLMFWCFGILLLTAGLICGQRLPLILRSLTSIIIIYWAFGTCLVGRTTEPGISRATFIFALQVFILYGLLPGVVLLRLWPLRLGATFLVALFPVGFLLAATVAGAEEYLFVQKYHESGTGPTPRWTVSNHWLAYDKEKKRLYGSD